MFTLTECIGLCLIAAFIGFVLRPSWWATRRVATPSFGTACTPATKDAEPSPYASWNREEMERQLSQRWERIQELEGKCSQFMADRYTLMDYFMAGTDHSRLRWRDRRDSVMQGILDGVRGKYDPARRERKELAAALALYVGQPEETRFGPQYNVAVLMRRHADIQQVARIHGTKTLLPLTVHESFDWPPTTGVCPTCVKRITTHITETFGGQHVDASKPRSS